MSPSRAFAAAAPTAAIAVIVVLLAISSAISGQIVLDIEFDDLADAVQEFDFLAVAFYAPGCGRCRRLLPSWTQAAELLIREQLLREPIRLARMDVTSAGGMGAWKAFELNRVPTVKVFVGNSANEPLAYTGHLDAGGIAAHLAMLERDHRRRLELESKYYYGHNKPRNSHEEGAIVASPDVPTLTVLLTSPLPNSRSPDGSHPRPTVESPPSLPRERFREAIAGKGLAVVLFVFQGSPRAHRMVSELYRAAETLAENDPPMKVVHVDLSSAADDESKGRKGARESSHEAAIAYRQELVAVTGASTLGDTPELRIFLDGKPWVDGGHHFRGMPTAEGIVEHMRWVAAEVKM